MHNARRLSRASWALALVPLALVACSDGTSTTATTSAVATAAGSAATSTADSAPTSDATPATGTDSTSEATGTTAAAGTTSPSSGFSVAASLRQIPTSALDDDGDPSSSVAGSTAGGSSDDIVVVSGDLDQASKLAGVSRPKAGDDPQQITQWVSAITGLTTGAGSPGIAIIPAEAFDLESFATVDAIGDELGWTALDVSTYVELQAPPQVFTAMSGTFDQRKIDAAQGDRSHDIWSLGGDDFSVDVAKTSPARPLGQALRTGLNRDGWLAQARSGRPIADWLLGSNALDRDDGLESVAKALDEQQVYSAMLVRSGFGPDPALSSAPAGAQPMLQRFDTLGVGSDHDDAGPILVLAYHSADEKDATANVDLLRTLFTDGSSAVTKQMWSHVVKLDDVQRDGKVVVVTMHVLDGRSPTIGVQGVQARDSFATHV